MSPKSLLDLERSTRRRVMIRSILRTGVSVVGLFVLYAVFPLRHVTALGALLLLVVGLVVVAYVLAVQIRSIARADYPEVRAIESVVLTVAVLVVVFSLVYLTLSSQNEESFSEPLDKVSAFYYSISVLSTVGFGDISASTDAARIVVTIQMLLDLTLVVVIVRIIFGVARESVGRSTSE